MPQRFTATEKAIESGLAKTDPAAGAKLAAEWATEVGKIEGSAAKTLHTDLLALEKELKGGKPDAAHLTKLMQKLGAESTKLASHATDPKVAEKVKHLASALSHFGK